MISYVSEAGSSSIESASFEAGGAEATNNAPSGSYVKVHRTLTHIKEDSHFMAVLCTGSVYLRIALIESRPKLKE